MDRQVLEGSVDGLRPGGQHGGRYPNISDHGLIGDLQTAALVTTDGTVDWFCCPRFDSPSVCASLLDADRGGYFRVGPDRDDYVSKQLYFPETAILITRFMTPDGVGEVHDFMPVEPGAATGRHRLVRQLRVVRGTMRFVMCTFWYVDALARAGRLDEARLTFEKMHTYANHLGLYSEEIGSTGEQLGNFPQAFSHLALISAAINLDYQLDHGAGTAAVVSRAR